MLVSPELASVLATVITRLRRANHGNVALARRYDNHERVTGPALPHLFQRRTGTRNSVISTATVTKLINLVLAASELKDATSQPLAYTPHDFRRIFASEAVASGLPIHVDAGVHGRVCVRSGASDSVFTVRVPHDRVAEFARLLATFGHLS